MFTPSFVLRSLVFHSDQSPRASSQTRLLRRSAGNGYGSHDTHLTNGHTTLVVAVVVAVVSLIVIIALVALCAGSSTNDRQGTAGDITLQKWDYWHCLCCLSPLCLLLFSFIHCHSFSLILSLSSFSSLSFLYICLYTCLSLSLSLSRSRARFYLIPCKCVCRVLCSVTGIYMCSLKIFPYQECERCSFQWSSSSVTAIKGSTCRGKSSGKFE